ncbi:GGDEF domain-containing protein [Chitinimonas taiwanensis]|uniref:GGDEF domain-containing protein n=1 Tax=Chitinimonas taiwanensis TaxID=240412 RepID=UPI0035B44378
MRPTQLPSLLDRLASLTAIRDTELLEHSLLRTLLPMLGVATCQLYRVNERHEFLRAIRFEREISAQGEDSARITENIERVLHQVDVPEDIQLLIDVVRQNQQPTFQSLGQAVCNVFPLLGGVGINGYLVFESRRPLAQSEETLVRGILSVYRNYAALLEESQRDKLTGLLNRHSLDQNVDKLLTSIVADQLSHNQPDQAQDSATSPRQYYWLGIVDIDHFKQINDNFGHVIGDEVLLLVARLMQRSLRSSDLLYRYGGEEFIVITASSERNAAGEQFERLRHAVGKHRFPQVGQVTVSGGYAQLDGHFSAHEIISRADQALYQAKRAGRNRIFSYAELIEAGVLKEASYGSVELF